MTIRTLKAALVFLLSTGIADAEVPDVVSDIPPVQSLVAMVMQDLARPGVIVRAGASPHAYSLRPSEARALQNASVIFRIGDDLTPWLGPVISEIAGEAEVISLNDTEGTNRLDRRESKAFASAHEDDHHGPADPHSWLDIENGKLWLAEIARVLSLADPEHEEIYRANAEMGIETLSSLETSINSELAGFHDIQFLVYHDSIRYFEYQHNIAASGSVLSSDADTPGAARVEKLRDMVEKQALSCILVEPGYNSGLVQNIFGDSSPDIITIDVLGGSLEAGPGLYPELLKNLSAAVADCS